MCLVCRDIGLEQLSPSFLKVVPSYITLLHLMTRTTSGEATGGFPGKINTSSSYFTKKISLCKRKKKDVLMLIQPFVHLRLPTGFFLSPSRHTTSQALSFTDQSGHGTRMGRRPPRSSVRSMKSLSDQTDSFYQMASFSEEVKSCLKKKILEIHSNLRLVAVPSPFVY